MTQRHLFGNPALMHFWVFLVLVRGHFIRYKKCLVIFYQILQKFAIRKKYLSVKYALDMKFHARYNSMNMRKHEQKNRYHTVHVWKLQLRNKFKYFPCILLNLSHCPFVFIRLTISFRIVSISNIIY